MIPGTLLRPVLPKIHTADGIASNTKSHLKQIPPIASNIVHMLYFLLIQLSKYNIPIKRAYVFGSVLDI